MAGPEPWLEQWSEVSPGFPALLRVQTLFSVPQTTANYEICSFTLLRRQTVLLLHSVWSLGLWEASYCVWEIWSVWSSSHLLHCCFSCPCSSATDIWSKLPRESWKFPFPHIFFILFLSPAPQNPLMMFLPSLSPLTTMFCDKSYSCSQHGKFAVILNNHLLSPQSATSPLISLFFGCLFWLALSHGAIRKSCFTSHATAMLIQKTGLQPKRCYFFHSLSFFIFFSPEKVLCNKVLCKEENSREYMRTHGFYFISVTNPLRYTGQSQYNPNFLIWISVRATEISSIVTQV